MSSKTITQTNPWLRRLVDKLSGRKATIFLVTLALLFGIVTFIILSGGVATAYLHRFQWIIFLLDIIVLVLVSATLVIRILRLFADRRSGLAGAKIHTRLVILFGVVSVIPTILVGIFASILFHYGIQIWFNDRVSKALNEAMQASRGYLQEHNANIRTEAFSLANYIQGMENNLAQTGQDLFEDPNALDQILDSQATLRGLNAALIYNPYTHKIIASGGLMSNVSNVQDIPSTSTAIMSHDDVSILDSPDEKTVRAAITLNDTPPMILLIIRPVDPSILNHMNKTEQVVGEYNKLSDNRSKIQIIFVFIFAMIALLVLMAAVLIGLYLANQIARPVGLLILAAQRVSEGDLKVFVPEQPRDDEISGLSRAFNRMTNQLAMQHTELIEANRQIDERRRFTEAVLSGVSSGVIGLDTQCNIELPNQAASALLGIDLSKHIGEKLIDIVPEFSPLIEDMVQSQRYEIQVGPNSHKRVLLAQIGSEIGSEEIEGFVVTFDDITELQSAQRKAAWADVARRIAHEIKNPLTPIQLAAERLKRRFMKEISSDTETFSQCVDTIVRHVKDIGRMVDEFSSFARMPQPVMKSTDLSRIVREALILQKNAHPEIQYHTDLQDHGPIVDCDQRLIGQALTNLLQNAADAIGMKSKDKNVHNFAETETLGNIWVQLKIFDQQIYLSVADDGIGLPQEDRLRLTEPYVTHKPKGTGLGLAIVKKIMEDHAGTIELNDRPDGNGAVSVLIFQMRGQNGA